MGELWSYRLEDLILFSDRAWYGMLETYHREQAPLQLVAKSAAALLFGIIVFAPAAAHRLVPALLAAGWAWTAWVFLHQHFAPLHWFADWYAIAFGLQSFLMLQLACHDIRYDVSTGTRSLIAVVIIVTGMFGSPVFNLIEGRSLWHTELFGMTADATAMVTLGLSMLSNRSMRWYLMAIPLLWCAVSGATAWILGLSWWWVLPLAASVAAVGSFCAGENDRADHA